MTEDSGRGHVQPQQPSYSCCDIGHSLEVVGCVVFVVLGASCGVGRPLRSAKTSSTRKSYSSASGSG